MRSTSPVLRLLILPHKGAPQLVAFRTGQANRLQGVKANPLVTVPFIQKWLKTIGVDREWNVFRLIRSLPDRPSHSALAGETSVSSLKESLMRLLQLPIPPHARKVAENAVQYITGQQLLLSTPHDANWQYVLLHLPLYAAEGRDASVHVWSSSHVKGEIGSR